MSKKLKKFIVTTDYYNKEADSLGEAETILKESNLTKEQSCDFNDNVYGIYELVKGK